MLVIYRICFLFRFIEYFLIRTDQTFWGEAFLHKLAGIAVLCVALKLLACKPVEIGFAKQNILRNTVLGLAFGLAVFAVAYGAEIMLAVSQGKFLSLQLYVSSYAVDTNIGNRTGILFFAICIAGNIINVLMEEGVFRGLFQKMLEQKHRFLAAAVLSAVLFGLWHIIGPMRNFYDGVSSMGGMIANILLLVATSALGGIKFALLNKLSG